MPPGSAVLPPGVLSSATARRVERTISGSKPRRMRNAPMRWRAFRSEGNGRPRRWRCSATRARSASPAGRASPSSRGSVSSSPRISSSSSRGTPCPVQASLELPSRSRARAEEADRDLHRRLCVRWLAPGVLNMSSPARGHGCAALPYSASGIPSTPTSIDATLPRISDSTRSASSGWAFRKSREFSRPWPRRVSP